MSVIYLSTRSGFDIRLCDPTVPCVVTAYDPAQMGWNGLFALYDLNELDSTMMPYTDNWIDDFNSYEPPPEENNIIRYAGVMFVNKVGRRA
jgi:hypothetical protein